MVEIVGTVVLLLVVTAVTLAIWVPYSLRVSQPLVDLRPDRGRRAATGGDHGMERGQGAAALLLFVAKNLERIGDP